ncbi:MULTISPECIES: PTS sugar transporter subunit IIB [Dolosigranulum]|uniref:PTS sugar transporter subunit IIB n=1 Tax=Dolosigranulum savutiense TaxID=3110288 RepID=A0AB74TM19_9LACT|nr:PTS sugar transporter subunit IIB [Dolosigranulum pigrum]RAN54086.1 PTS N-acetylgalactosamine transporter subunit IIB [Dolosigranulum pigrum]RAN56093.1 PTS N-acetylgalactosamine transporter subunit IIB [Dolosigranulum pigrum]
MNKPDIKMARIDERLVHGQVQMWIRKLGVNLCIVANDATAEDKLQQSLMSSVVNGVGMRFFTLDKTIKIIHKAAPSQKILLIVKNPKDALKLVENNVPISDLNIGNIHYEEGKTKFSNYISIGEDDKNSLYKLINDYGVNINTQTSPMAPDADLKDKLIKFINN